MGMGFLSFFSFKRFYLFIFLREGKGRREREKHQSVDTSCTLPTEDLAHDSGMCPDWESNQPPFGPQAGTQSTEPHQPGQYGVCYNRGKAFEIMECLRF